MRYRHHQLDVAHTLSTYFFLGHLYTATVADDAFVTDTLVFTAMTLIVLYRAEYAFAEQTIALWLVGSVIDGLRLQYFTT